MLASPRNLTPAQRKFLWVIRASWIAKVAAIGGLFVVLVLLGVL